VSPETPAVGPNEPIFCEVLAEQQEGDRKMKHPCPYADTAHDQRMCGMFVAV